MSLKHNTKFYLNNIDNDQKMRIIKDYIDSLSLKVDSLCLHDYKLKKDKVEGNIQLLWKTKKDCSLEVSPSNKAEDMKVGVRRRDIGPLFHPRMQPLIMDK